MRARSKFKTLRPTIVSRTAALVIALIAASIASAPCRAGTIIDGIRARGSLVCGVAVDAPGTAMPDSRGRYVGFHVEVCRAIAAALFGDSEKVKFVPLTALVRFTALQAGEIDVWSASTALTLDRDTALGLTIPVASFYTGQGFLVNKRIRAKSAADLNGATICAIQGGVVERNVSDYMTKVGMKMQLISFETPSALLSAFFSGRCDAISNDMVTLGSYLIRTANRDDYELLPELIAKEPHGPLVRSDDLQWATLVRWVIFALIQAEEFGLTQGNVAQAFQSSTDPKVQRFLGKGSNPGAGLGLPSSWAYEVVRQVGNYGELFDRHLGQDGLKLDRGLNKLWTKGGMMTSWLWQ